jgi:hypothetical protein
MLGNMDGDVKTAAGSRDSMGNVPDEGQGQDDQEFEWALHDDINIENVIERNGKLMLNG